MRNISDASKSGVRAPAWWPRLLGSLGVVAVAAVGLVGERMALADTPSSEAVQISDVPVGTYANQDKPNVMLLMDTSHSMRWTHMPDDWDPVDFSVNYFPVGYKSSLCNTLYYNPNTKYELPSKPDGTAHAMPAFTAAWTDGYDQSKGVVNLATSFQAYDASTRSTSQPSFNDPAQPAYYFEWVPRVAGGVLPSFEGAGVSVGACFKVSNAAIKNDNGSLAMNQPSANINTGSTTAPDGSWVRRGLATTEEQTNFSIWYSYYRTRINMAKSSISLAFNSLDNNFRVGFLTVAKPTLTDYFKFVPVKDFESSDKANWFQSIQSAKAGETSPMREALARVGRYYGNKSDSINAGMGAFADPVVSACQRHYAIVTTDGYWNVAQETSGPMQLDGTTLVGQQDGPDTDPAYNRPLTGADGLTPRPIYDGSTSGDLHRRDASVNYAWNACTYGWETTTPGGGTKTETIYKKTIKKSVQTKTNTYGTVLGYFKSTNWNEQKSVLKLNWSLSSRNYWQVSAVNKIYKKTFKRKYTWNSITQSQYRNVMTTSWATEMQKPYSKAVIKKVEQRRYFYSYKNQTGGVESALTTTDPNVCAPYGCTLVGSLNWAVVQSCSPGMDGNYKVECQDSETPVSANSYCGSNGQYLPGQGTVYCEGSNVPPINGPVPACGTLHPDLVAAGVSANLVIFSGCDSNHVETSYVTDAQCVNSSPAAPEFKKKQCAPKVPYTSSTTNNYCTAGVSSENIYTTCSAKKGSTQYVDTCPADLTNNATKMDQVCGDPELYSSSAVNASTCVASTIPLVKCEDPYTTTYGTTAVNPATCTGDTVCKTMYSDWVYASSCTPKSPSSDNKWIGTECSTAGGSCTPAAGAPPQPNGAVESCTAAGPTPANGCFEVTCDKKTTDPVEDTSCSTTPGPSASNGWVTTVCVDNNKANQPVESCPVAGAVTNCVTNSTSVDMAYGSCEERAATAENGWTTTTCLKKEDTTYLTSAAEFAACQANAGITTSGVETICEQEGPTTVTVPPGEVCYGGYDATSHKVTDCSGVTSGTPVFTAEKPATCTLPTCVEVQGKKKVFSGTATTYRINLVGTTEVGAPQQVSSETIPVTNLESPPQCYSLDQAATMTLPTNGRPLRSNSVVWGALPSAHQACPVQLPCDTVQQATITGGSRNSLADVAQYYYATDLRPELANLVKPAGTGAEDDKVTWQHMATYVIGMGVSGTLKFDKDYKNGAGDFAALRNGSKPWPIWPLSTTTDYEQPQSIDDFWHTAVNGRGLYFSANDPQTIKSGLSQVFTDIRAAVGSGAGVAVSSAVVETGNNYAYGALYRSGRWSGDVLAYQIDVTSGARTQIQDWSAKTKLDTRDLATDDRKIYFMDSTGTPTLKNFNWSDMGSAQKGYFTGTAAQSMLSQYSQMSATQQSAALGENLVGFLRGDRSKESFAQGDVNKLYRSRDSRLGDIISSQPLYVGKPQRKYKDQGYASFRLAQQNRKPMVYVGGNDGMLHAFYAEADLQKQEVIGGNSVYTAAREAWAFVPAEVMPSMPILASLSYESSHRYFVDGSPVMADIYDDNESIPARKWKTILVGGFNKGGKGYYALDITDPEAPKALWESKVSSMGQSFGKPLVSKLPDGTWAVFVTSGYNNSDGKAYVYVLNAATGALIQTIDTGTGSGLKDLNNYVTDPSGNNTTTLFYGGDLLGNIWRFQWSSGSFGVAKVVQLTDGTPSNNPQPITTRLELVQSQSGSGALPRILVATGRLLGVNDLSTTGQQSIYGFDDTVSGYSSGASLRAGLKRSELANVTGADGKLTRTLQCKSSTADCDNTSKGWFVDLPDTGERVNVDLRLAGTTLVVSSNIPSTEPCVSGGKGWVNYLNFQTGRAVNEGTDGKGQAGEQIDGLIAGNDLTVTKDGQVTSHVQATTGEPSDIGIPVATPKPLGKRISWRELVK